MKNEGRSIRRLKNGSGVETPTPAATKAEALGRLIAIARKRENLTQSALAELVGVSVEAVSKWERGAYAPAPDKLAQLEAVLHLSYYDESGELKSGRLFDEDHMSAFLNGKFASGQYPEAKKALAFAKAKHRTAPPRSGPGNVPYIAHPLTMACHALALGLNDDLLLAALLLHDVTEENGIPPAEMPVCGEVREIVALVSKPKHGYDAGKYFDGIAENARACMVKCIDCCNNLSTMAMSFTPERMSEYIRETETWYPRLLRIIKERPEYNNAAWLLAYQIRSLLETAKMIR